MSPNEKAIVLLSGGLDSTVALAEALTRFDIVKVLTFNYGQRASGKEIRSSRLIAEHYGLSHEIVALPWLANLLPEAMRPRRTYGYAWGEKGSDAFYDATPVWVPNRNGVFLNIAAAYAEALGATTILFGANAEEGERFPDNTATFRDKMTDVFSVSTLSHPKVVCPVGELQKPEIIARGRALNVPLHLIWSCYSDADIQCGQCPSCVRLKNAISAETTQKTASTQKLSFMY